MEQFSLEKWLENPSRKIVTRQGKSVRIICTDRRHIDSWPIVALEDYGDGEFVIYANIDGRTDMCSENIHDLFFADEEDGLTKFEKELQIIISEASHWTSDDGSISTYCQFGDKEIKKISAQVLDLARKEILKDLPKWKNFDFGADFINHITVISATKFGVVIYNTDTKQFISIKELENQYVLHSKNGDELNSITIVDRSSCVVEEPASEELDFLVISLEETIGTSPHSREVIKEYLQKAAEWGRTHFEDKSEMVCEDLEEYYTKEFLPKEWFAKPGHRTISQFNFFTAQHFAEWQRKKDQETIELAEDHAVLAGMMKEREEMMKDAVEGEYWIGEIHLDTPIIQGYNDGDRIKFIPIKNE